MAAGWPFFAALLGNMEMVLAKSDMGIAARYAELAVGVDGHDAIFTRIRDGWNRAHDGLPDITGQTRFLEKNPALAASIRLRARSEERRGGKELISTCRSRWSVVVELKT